MTIEGLSIAATVVLVLPMLYFSIATLTFFLAKFDDPIVARMLRGLFNSYFILVVLGCAIGTLAFLAAYRPVVALGIGLLGALAVAARRWFLARIDAQLRAGEGGDLRAVRRLRRLHLGGMLYNAVQFAAVLVSIPTVLMRL